MIEPPKDSEYSARVNPRSTTCVRSVVTDRTQRSKFAGNTTEDQEPYAAQQQRYGVEQARSRRLDPPLPLGNQAVLPLVPALGALSFSNPQKIAHSAYIAQLKAPFLQAVRDGFPGLWREIKQNGLSHTQQILAPRAQQNNCLAQKSMGPEAHIKAEDLNSLVLECLFNRQHIPSEDLRAIIDLTVKVFPSGKSPGQKFLPKLLHWLSFSAEQLHLLEVLKMINRHMDSLGASQILIEEFCISMTDACDAVGYNLVCRLLNQFSQMCQKSRSKQNVMQTKIYETFAVHRKRSLKERWLLLCNLNQLAATYPDGAMTLELLDQLTTLCLCSSGSAGVSEEANRRDLHALEDLSDPSRDSFVHDSLWFTLRYSFGSFDISQWIDCASFILRQIYLGKKNISDDIAREYVVHRAGAPQRMRLSELLLILKK